jgi:hypothetical protein
VRTVPICSICRTGFDVAKGIVPTCPKCGAVWSPAVGEGGEPGSRFSFSHVILHAAVLICSVGCAVAVVKTILGLVTLEPVFSIVGLPPKLPG